MGDFSRRKFLAGIAGVAASSAVSSLACAAHVEESGGQQKLPISFSTLGCPSWSWDKILSFAQQHSFAAIELRMLLGNVDLPTCPEFSPSRIDESRSQLAAHGLSVSCVDTSAYLNEPDPKEHASQLADARRFIDLASELGSPYIRVTGNEISGSMNESISRIARSLHQLGDYSGPKQVTVLIESHGDFVKAELLLEILTRADSPHVGVLWDTHNSYVVGQEDPAITVASLGKNIRHTHFKDSVGRGDQHHYVLTGRGEVPIKRVVQLLVDMGYPGYYSFEWEKAWHPDIADPEVAISDYSQVMMGFLKDCYARRQQKPKR